MLRSETGAGPTARCNDTAATCRKLLAQLKESAEEAQRPQRLALRNAPTFQGAGRLRPISSYCCAEYGLGGQRNASKTVTFQDAVGGQVGLLPRLGAFFCLSKMMDLLSALVNVIENVIPRFSVEDGCDEDDGPTPEKEELGERIRVASLCLLELLAPWLAERGSKLATTLPGKQARACSALYRPLGR